MKASTRPASGPPFYRSFSFWAATLLSIFAIAPLLRPGYFWAAHDARHDVFFVLQYNITWDEGVLFPRWSPDWAFGYGYPFFNLVAPGATFVGTLLYRLFPLGLEGAVKGTFALSILISAWGMWFFVRDWLDARAALIAAVAYVYVPYHLFDIYVRAAMGEVLAISLLPFALWAVRRATLRPSAGSIVGVALAYAALHLSHNFIALLATPLLSAYALVLALAGVRRSVRVWLRHLLPPALGMTLGLALAGFFTFPALLEFRFVRSDQWYGGYYDFHDHFVYFAQLFDPRWGFGISVPGSDDVISYQLGLAPLLLALLGLWAWWRYSRLTPRHAADAEPPAEYRHLAPLPLYEAVYWYLVLLAGAVLATGTAAWAWDHVPLVSSAQFPWRYLTLAALALAILAPAILLAENVPSPLDRDGGVGKRGWLAPLLLAGLIILGSTPYLQMQTPPPPPGGATLAGLMEFERSADEMTGMTITADEIATWSPLADLHMAGRPIESQVDYGLVHANPDLAVDAREHRVDSELVWVHAEKEGLRVPFYRQWFPGWTATIIDPETGAELERFPLTQEHTRPPYGLLDVPVPAGDHLLRISFEDTPVRSLSEMVSRIAAAFTLLLFLWHLRPARLRRPPSTPTGSA